MINWISNKSPILKDRMWLDDELILCNIKFHFNEMLKWNAVIIFQRTVNIFITFTHNKMFSQVECLYTWLWLCNDTGFAIEKSVEASSNSFIDKLKNWRKQSKFITKWRYLPIPLSTMAAFTQRTELGLVNRKNYHIYN